MKKSHLIFFSIAISFVIFSIYYTSNPNRSRETYVKIISKKQFHSKLKNAPTWMDEQIKDDVAFIKSKKVTQEALAETFETMKRNFAISKKDFIRYRIVDNKLYQCFLDDEKTSKKEEAFEKAIKTILKLKKLPDVDFIYSHIDGLPSKVNKYNTRFYYEDKRDFYLVKDERKQAPVFTRAKSKDVKEGILIPDYVALSELWPKLQKKIIAVSSDVSWTEKAARLHWRGASSKTERFNLCELSLKHQNIIDAGFVDTINDRKIEELKLWGKLDIYQFLKRDFANKKEQLNHKYLPVLDGVMCTYPGYHWRLLSNSLVLKQTSDEIQWFYKALKPYVHYVPIEHDLSDILEKVNWAVLNDDKCQEIVQEATDFVLNNLMLEDVYVYFYKALLEYSKHQDFTKKDLKQDLKNDKRWVAISNRRKGNEILKKRGLL